MRFVWTGHTGDQTRARVKGHNTCSKASLLLSLSQMAVGAEVGVGGRRRVGRFGPTFPLNEVGDPALGQGGGLRYMVPHCLRDTWTKERTGQSAKLRFFMRKGKI